jgi:uncharacterized phage protein (TIGR02218 family)
VKTFSAALTAAYASGSTTLCNCLRVHRTDDIVVRFTSADHDVTVGGELYLAATGLDVTSLAVQANLAVDNMELPVLPDEVSYPQVDIISGRWDGARFWLFECDYTDAAIASGSPVGEGAIDGIVNLLKRGTAGEASTVRTARKFELRGLKQALQQMVGEVASKTCRNRLGDARCGIDLSAGSPPLWQRTAPVTTVTSRHVLAFSSAAGDPDDFYGEGIAYAIDGDNAGYARKIKSFSAGVVTLAMEFPFVVLVSDTFLLEAGCRKRLMEDCKAKFDNVRRFRGEAHMGGIDILTADPVATEG